MIRAEQVLIAGLLLLGVLFLIGGQSLSFRADIGFGPGFVPISAAVALILACAARVFQTYRLGRPEKVDQDHNPDWRGLAMTMAILVAGTATMTLGSVLIPLAVMTLLLSWLVSGHSLARASLVAIAVIAVIYVIFRIWLGLPLK